MTSPAPTTTSEFAQRLETLATYRLDIGLAERLTDAAAYQRMQGDALAEAARVIREQQATIEELRARCS